MANTKRVLFNKRRLRVRNKLRKVNAGRPRLSVHRSNKNISVQLIDDVDGKTLASASSMEKALGVVGKNTLTISSSVSRSCSLISPLASVAIKTMAQRPRRGYSIRPALLKERLDSESAV